MKTIKIKGLSCSHCVTAVAEALSAVPGVIKVDVKLKKLFQKDSVAICEGEADEALLTAAIEEAGYQVLEIS